MGTENSTLVKKLKSIRPVIKGLLEGKEIYRDSDEALVSRFWYNEVIAMGFHPDKISANELLKIQARNELTSVETIIRARRRVQELHPELRGKKWDERHGLSDDVVKNVNNL